MSKILQELEDSYHSNRTDIAHVKYELAHDYWDDNDIEIKITFLDGILKGRVIKGEIHE